MNRRAILIGMSATVLSGCSEKPSPPPPPAPPPSSPWQFWYSEGVPTAPIIDGDGWWFDAPRAPGHVNYLIKPGRYSLRNRFAIAGNIEQSDDAAWSYKTNPDNTCDGVANFRFYIQRAGDDLSGAGPMASYRWWSNPCNVELKAGAYDADVNLWPSQWSNVYGKFGSDVPAEFNAAIADVQAVGLTFGGGCFFGHGVQLLSGSARVRCTSFEAT